MEKENVNKRGNEVGQTIIIDSDKKVLELISALPTTSEGKSHVVKIINGAKLHFKKEKGEEKTEAILPSRLHLIIENGALEIGSGMTLTIGEGSEITVSSTGWIEGDGTLNGNFTHINAPMKQVFYNGLDVGGNWSNGRIYPQWFGAVAYDCEAPSNPEYSSDAIMKSAKMAGTGEVFISRGFYILDKPIDLDCGVTISGEPGLYKNDKFGTILIAKLNYSQIGWEITEDKSSGGIKNEPKYDKNGDCVSAEQPLSNYLFRINIDPNKVGLKMKLKMEYPPMCATIRNLRIKNKTYPKKFFVFDKLLSCVLAGDSTAFDNVIFDDFGQAVRYVDQYLDNKRVTNCTFYCNPPEYTGTLKLYAFDMGFLGDGVLFEHNAIHDGIYNKGLRLSNSGGASVNANIINADVLIHNCRGVDFSENHIEERHTIRINSSQASLRNNFIWIGNSPSVMVHADDYQNKSIVTMSGNVFRFIDTVFYTRIEKDKNNKDVIVVEDDMPSNEAFECAAEVAVDEFSALDISNCFRYWGGRGFGGTQVSGIHISKMEGVDAFMPFDEFNNFSYSLSQRSTISGGFEIDGRFSVDSVPASQISPIAMLNENVLWRGENGEYSYTAQVLFDAPREIGLDAVDISFWEASGSKGNVNVEVNQKGVLINLGKSSGRYLLRLVRMRSDDLTFKYVDIPICDTTYLYDNGLSVNGFKWTDCDDWNAVVVNSTLECFEYNSGKVRVFASGRLWPIGDGWKKGDVVYLPDINTVKAYK